ncbi:MAG TPA: sulfotransferase [Planctomycetes bacterium]|nr:sulfotransferase [Planctomycetota bacterium]
MEDASDKAVERSPATPAPPVRDLKRVFIVGFPRSGTTWVMLLLARLPGVSVLQQAGLFHALEGLDRWWGASHRFSNGAPEPNRSTDEILDREDYRRLVRPVADHVFQAIAAETPGTEVVVEQTPENLQFHDEILELFPDAYFLHVVRDPRDAACSMRRAARSWDNDFPGRPIHIARRWVEYANRARTLASKTKRFHSVRYEDLLERGPEELARIASWMGLELSDADCVEAVEACSLRRLKDQEAERVPNGFFGKGQSGAWRGELSRSDLRILEYVLGDELEAAGYVRDHPRSRSKPFAVTWHEILALRGRRPQRALADLLRPVRQWFAFHRREREYTRAHARN